MRSNALVASQPWSNGTPTSRHTIGYAPKHEQHERLRRRFISTLDTPAPTLREVQRGMGARIVDAQRLSTAAPEAAEAENWLAERLGVYAGGYPVRVQEALAETYPAVAHLVGDGAFAGLVRRFVAAVPLCSYNLNDAGVELPAFLRHDRLSVGLPFLPDLARLEWQLACAFHAHEQTPLDPSAVAAWSLDQWQQAVVRFQP